MSSAAPRVQLLSVVVPAYNEVQSIANTLAEMRAYFRTKPYRVEIIVAADGTDGTRERVRSLAEQDADLHVVGTPERRGKGHGVRQGVAMARGDIVGFVDADNKTPIEEFDQFEPLLLAGADIVIGSRGLRMSKIERPQPWYRRIGSKAFAVVMHTAVGLHDIVDTQCGFKFFQGQLARDLFSRVQIDGYMFDVEVLALASWSGCDIRQVPVRWRDDGDSRLQLVRGNIRNGQDLLRIARRRFGAVAAHPRPRRSGSLPTATPVTVTRETSSKDQR